MGGISCEIMLIEGEGEGLEDISCILLVETYSKD